MLGSSSPWQRTIRSNWFVLLLPPILWLAVPLLENPNWVDPYYANILMLIGINIVLATSLQLINGISGQFSLGHAGFMAIGAYAAGYATQTCSIHPTDGRPGPAFVNPGGVLLFFVAVLVIVCLIGSLLWGAFKLSRLSGRRDRRLPGIVALGLVLWFVIDLCIASHLGPRVWLIWDQFISGIQTLFAMMIQHGLPGAAALSRNLPESWLKPLCLLIALAGGAVLAGVAGLLVGLPTLRLRGDYLAIATLGFGEIIRVIITNCRALGQATGLQVTAYSDVRSSGQSQGHFIFRWIAAFAFLTPLLVWRLARSPRGQTIRAVREDEVAATAVGIDPTRQKVTAFVIGAALAGVGGGLFAHCFYYLNPNSFGFMRSVELVVMVTIAGLGNVWWTVVWAAALTYLEEDFLRTIGQHLGYPQLAQWRMVLYSLLLILIPISQATLFPRLRGAWRRKMKSATDGAQMHADKKE